MATQQQIQIIRGLKASVATHGAFHPGELAFCTDSKEVYIGDGLNNYFVGRALSGDFASRPAAGNNGRFYYVSSGTSNLGYLFFDTGTAWIRINSLALSDLTGSLDNIVDGATYVRIKATEATNGLVNRLNNGSIAVTVTEARNHIDDATKHRVINDSSTAITDLWSAQKIRNEIELAKHNIEPQASCKDKDLLIPPNTPATGDRYIIATGTATGAWVGKNTQIAEWDGSSWDFYIPNVGWTAYIDDEQKVYSWNSTAWVRTGGALQTITAGTGLNGGGQSDTVAINIGQGNGITVSADAIAVTPDKGITVSATGVAANIDGVSIIYDSAYGNRLVIGTVDGGTF